MLISAATESPGPCQCAGACAQTGGGEGGGRGRELAGREVRVLCCSSAPLPIHGKACWRLPALGFVPVCIAQGLFGEKEGRKEEDNAALKRITFCLS